MVGFLNSPHLVSELLIYSVTCLTSIAAPQLPIEQLSADTANLFIVSMLKTEIISLIKDSPCTIFPQTIIPLSTNQNLRHPQNFLVSHPQHHSNENTILPPNHSSECPLLLCHCCSLHSHPPWFLFSLSNTDLPKSLCCKIGQSDLCKSWFTGAVVSRSHIKKCLCFKMNNSSQCLLLLFSVSYHVLAHILYSCILNHIGFYFKSLIVITSKNTLVHCVWLLSQPWRHCCGPYISKKTANTHVILHSYLFPCSWPS